jgi:hypothetical protein
LSKKNGRERGDIDNKKDKKAIKVLKFRQQTKILLGKF